MIQFRVLYQDYNIIIRLLLVQDTQDSHSQTYKQTQHPEENVVHPRAGLHSQMQHARKIYCNDPKKSLTV